MDSTSYHGTILVQKFIEWHCVKIQQILETDISKQVRNLCSYQNNYDFGLWYQVKKINIVVNQYKI